MEEFQRYLNLVTLKYGSRSLSFELDLDLYMSSHLQKFQIPSLSGSSDMARKKRGYTDGQTQVKTIRLGPIRAEA